MTDGELDPADRAASVAQLKSIVKAVVPSIDDKLAQMAAEISVEDLAADLTASALESFAATAIALKAAKSALAAYRTREQQARELAAKWRADVSAASSVINARLLEMAASDLEAIYAKEAAS